MISTQFPEKAYQLAAQYQLGEPIRVYRTQKLQELQSSAWILAILALLFLVPPLWSSGFHLQAFDEFIYGIYIGSFVLVGLIAVISVLWSPNTTVYICTAGLLIFKRSASEAVRWEQIARVEQKETNSPCIISLIDSGRADITLGRYIGGLQELLEEIELKVRLAKDPEQASDLEAQFEHAKNEQVERQTARKLLYQTHKPYLATKDPAEAHLLGKEYQLGEPLGTYRSGLRSLPQSATLTHLVWSLLLAGPVVFSQTGIKPFWPTACLVGLALFSVFFVVPRIISRNTRLHIYTKGLLFIHSSLDILRWEQIEKVVFSASFFFSFCTLHLKNGEKLALGAFLEKQDAIKEELKSRIQKQETYPLKKGKNENDVYRDIGHLAD